VKISCPACSAKYSITDDKVQDRLAKIRCRKCGVTIVIDGKTQPPNVYTSAGEGGAATEAVEPSEPNNTEYSVDFGEGDQRALGLKELVAAYNSGQINGETYVWAEGFTDWKALGEVPQIVEALNAGPAAAAAPSPWDKPAAAAAKKAGNSVIPRAAARTGGRAAGSADLFGRIDSAGSEDDVSTSAPEQPSPLATPSASAGTGARNESSVLFSLSALTSAAQNQSRPSANGSSSRDDSGLIDLKALTAAAMKNEMTGAAPAVAPAFAPVTPAPLGVPAPLGFGSPLGSPIGSIGDLNAQQSRSKAPLFIGAGLAIGMLGIAGAILLKPAPPPPPAPVIVQAPPPPPVAAAPTTPPEPIAKPPATGAAEDDQKKPTTAGQPHKWTGGGGAKKPSGTSASPNTGSSPADKPAAPPPKRSACGCAPSDLQCNMRCAAKG